ETAKKLAEVARYVARESRPCLLLALARLTPGIGTNAATGTACRAGKLQGEAALRYPGAARSARGPVRRDGRPPASARLRLRPAARGTATDRPGRPDEE